MVRSIYIHIPFCNSICSYCDFTKFLYNDKWVNQYLNSLKKEIELTYNKELIDTIYIGGGTPSCLSLKELEKFFDIVKIINKAKNIEFTIEGNIESITEEKLKLFKKNGVNRLSLGLETFNEKHLKFLNRKHNYSMIKEKIDLCLKYFSNINVDLMYAFPTQTLSDLKEDLKQLLSLNVTHISCYSLIIEEHTKLFVDKIKSIDEDLDYNMYLYIKNTLLKKGYSQYEISNYSKIGYESRHNTVYWDNLNYYGFGIGASSYVNNVRYDNTKSLNLYLEGKYISKKEKLSKKVTIQNAFILGLRKIKGINISLFEKKYNIKMDDLEIVNKLVKENKLIKDKYLRINDKYIYLSNDILVEFLDLEV